MITKYKIAKLIGVTPTAVYSWQTGKTKPTLSNLQKLQTALRLKTLDEALRLIEPSQPSQPSQSQPSQSQPSQSQSQSSNLHDPSNT